MHFKLIPAAALICVLFAALLCAAPAAAQADSPADAGGGGTSGTPAITFGSLEHDFKTTGPDASLTHEFVFRNTGSAVLLIEKVKAG